MPLDRQAIERADFPIGRRGYDPGAVDAHLRMVAGELEELQRAAARGSADASLAASASTQVQSILKAAEVAASEIERSATGEARVHVAAVEQAAAALLERLASMESEVAALVESLRAGAGRLASELATLEGDMRELQGAASAQGADVEREVQPAAAVPLPPSPAESPAEAPSAPPPAGDEQTTQPVPGDLDGARLVALNMALNGESRADTERYLAENFELADHLKLIDEVYAAVEG